MTRRRPSFFRSNVALPKAVLPKAVLPKVALLKEVLPKAVLPIVALPKVVLPKVALLKEALPKVALPPVLVPVLVPLLVPLPIIAGLASTAAAAPAARPTPVVESVVDGGRAAAGGTAVGGASGTAANRSAATVDATEAGASGTASTVASGAAATVPVPARAGRGGTPTVPARAGAGGTSTVPVPTIVRASAARPTGQAGGSGASVALPSSVTGRASSVTAVPTAGLRVYGQGNGHGRGMSQYGARGYAEQGGSADSILGFFYPGATPTNAGNPSMRVRLRAADWGAVSLAPVAPATTVTGLVATGGDGRRVALPPASGYRVMVGTGGFAVQRAGTTWTTVVTLNAPVHFTGPATLNVRFGATKTDCRRTTAVTYSGSLRAIYSGGKAYYMADLPMESYLQGVVASEMPSSWPASALQAQAVAARTYAASRRSTSRFYDVYDTMADQRWDGRTSQAAATDAAIARTVGRILTSSGKPINAQFSSDSGGRTASGGVSYLPDRADPYSLAARSPYRSWSVLLSTTGLAAADGPGGLARVTGIQVAARSGAGTWGGRVESMVLSGTDSSGRAKDVTVSGAQFRSTLGLRSTYLGFATS